LPYRWGNQRRPGGEVEDDPGVGGEKLEPGKNSDEISQKITFKSPQPPFAKGKV